jgi:hypothetical protein
LDYEPDEIYVWETYTDTASGNVYAEVSATNGDCIDHDSLGMVIRVDRSAAAGGYSIEVSCDGAWRFRLHQIGADQIDLVEWTKSDAIHTGPSAVNRLGLWGYQARFPSTSMAKRSASIRTLAIVTATEPSACAPRRRMISPAPSTISPTGILKPSHETPLDHALFPLGLGLGL